MENPINSIDLFEFGNHFLPRYKNRELVSKHIFTQVVDAVKYLWSKDITHGDIKDENVLIDGQLDIKLIDFGSARSNKIFVPFHGTSIYAPPEGYSLSYFCEAADIWALGCMLYILFMGTVIGGILITDSI
jgi:serine/threonine protein kinase